MHRYTNLLLKVFLNSTNQHSMMKTAHHKTAVTAYHKLMQVTVRPAFFLRRQQASRSQVITGPWPFPRAAWSPLWVIQTRSHYFLLYVLLNIMTMNIALLLESCWIFHSTENIYEGPSGGCFLGGLMDLTIWLPLNPMQSLENYLWQGGQQPSTHRVLCVEQNIKYWYLRKYKVS